MRLQRFLSALVWCLVGGLGLAAVSVGASRVAHVDLPGAWWLPLLASSVLAVVVAGLIAVLTGPSRVDAAVAIDHLFGLNERLSTALTLPADLRETPAGRALVADAIRQVERLDIGSKFGLRRPRLAWVPIVPAALVVAFALLPEGYLPRAGAAPGTKGGQAKKVDPKAATKALQAVSKKFGEKKKQLDKVEATETGKLMAELQKAVEDMAKAPPADKQKALMQMNKLADAVKERQQKLGDAEQINRQLEQLKDLGLSGPADEFARELARGDFQKAAEQLKQLQEKLATGKMSEQEKQQLTNQLGAMKKQLEQMANMEQRKQQLQEALQKGQISKETFDQQMAKLQQQSQDLQKLQQLANQLGQAQQKMSQGDMQKAAEALGMTQKELEQMAQAAQEMEALDSAMADLQEAKDGMAGDALNQLGQQLEGMNRLGQGNRPGNGNGLGRGRGQGDRPEAPDNTSGYDSRVKQQITKGKVIPGGFASPAKQIKGESILEIQGNVEAAAGAAAEALTDQKIPSDYKKHVQGYFDKLRKGE
jgi:hypothetical protein